MGELETGPAPDLAEEVRIEGGLDAIGHLVVEEKACDRIQVVVSGCPKPETVRAPRPASAITDSLDLFRIISPPLSELRAAGGKTGSQIFPALGDNG